MKSLPSRSALIGALTWSKSTIGVRNGKIGHPRPEPRTLAGELGQYPHFKPIPDEEETEILNVGVFARAIATFAEQRLLTRAGTSYGKLTRDGCGTSRTRRSA